MTRAVLTRLAASALLLSLTAACSVGGTARGSWRLDGEGGGRYVAGVHGGLGGPLSKENAEANSLGTRGLYIFPEFEMAAGVEDRSVVFEPAFTLPAYKYFGESWGFEAVLWIKSSFGLSRYQAGPALEIGLLRPFNRSPYKVSYLSVDAMLQRAFGDDPGWYLGLGLGYDQIDSTPRDLH